METLPAPTKKVVGRPFQKGKSGNPGGRPKGVYDVRAECRDLTPFCLNVLKKIAGSTKTPESVRCRAVEIILERGWGKPLPFIGGEDAENAEGNPQLAAPGHMIIERVFVNAPQEHHHHHAPPQPNASGTPGQG